jgi:hypothetical protein
MMLSTYWTSTVLFLHHLPAQFQSTAYYYDDGRLTEGFLLALLKSKQSKSVFLDFTSLFPEYDITLLFLLYMGAPPPSLSVVYFMTSCCQFNWQLQQSPPGLTAKLSELSELSELT